MNHPYPTKQRGFSSVIDRRQVAQPPPHRGATSAVERIAKSAGPPKTKGPRADVVPYGIELAVLPRGGSVRLRISLERWHQGPVLVVTEWAQAQEDGGWYPRRARCAAFALNELDRIASYFDEARRRLPELPAEVQR